MRRALLVLLALVLVGAVVLTGWRFNSDMERAHAHAAQGGVLLPTRCGPIEVQQAGTGVPLLVVHGSGGGHDQGMAFAGALAQHGIRVIAMSRFGYALGAFASSVLFAWLYNRAEGSVWPVLILHTAVNAWSLAIPVMALPDGSNLRPFQLVVGILVFTAVFLLLRGGPTWQEGTRHAPGLRRMGEPG